LANLGGLNQPKAEIQEERSNLKRSKERGCAAPLYSSVAIELSNNQWKHEQWKPVSADGLKKATLDD
jgi:hypothetical protein